MRNITRNQPSCPSPIHSHVYIYIYTLHATAASRRAALAKTTTPVLRSADTRLSHTCVYIYLWLEARVLAEPC